jgi:hypothetical protein
VSALPPAGGEEPAASPGRGVRRVLRLVLLLFGLAVAGLAAAAWLAGDRSDLEMEYEGFD